MSSPERLDSIQLLRAIAAMAVVFHHTPLFGRGEWGVDLFFVVSGYVICLTTDRSTQNFLPKRLIRVIPLYWAGTLGVFAVALLAPALLKNTSASFAELLKSLLFIPFRKNEAVQPVLFLGWSLNMEMYFYAVFALAIALSARWRAAIASALIGAVVLAGVIWPPSSDIGQFYSRPIVLEFVYGMGLFSVVGALRERGLTPASWAGRAPWLVLGFGALALLPWLVGFKGEVDRSIVVGLPSALAFLGVVIGLWGLRLPPAALVLGDASYSLYLFHPYVLQAFRKLVHPLVEPSAAAYALSLVAIALCGALSILSYRLVEAPLTEWLRVRLLPRGGSGR